MPRQENASEKVMGWNPGDGKVSQNKHLAVDFVLNSSSFCSAGLPELDFQATVNFSLSALLINLSNIYNFSFEKLSEKLGIEPWTVGWEEIMLPLCYAADAASPPYSTIV